MITYAEVLLPFKFGEGTFTYSCDFEIKVGTRVRVTLRRKELVGVVFSISTKKPAFKVLPILEVIDDEPIMLPKQIQLVRFASDYYADSLGTIFRSILPPKIRDNDFDGNMQTAYRLCEPFDMQQLLSSHEKKPAQYRTLIAFAEKEVNLLSRKRLLKLGATDCAIRALSKSSVIEKTEIPRDKYFPVDISNIQTLEDVCLGDKHLVKFAMKMSDQVSFVETVSYNLASREQMLLVILPEKDESLVSALYDDYDDVITFFASDSSSQRANNYLRLLRHPESVRLVVGGRMSLLLPFKNLGHVIFFDEHDERYKGIRSPMFNARDMVLMLANKHEIQVTFFSSSPTLETMVNVKNDLFTFENHDTSYPVKVLEKGEDLLSKYSRQKMEEVLVSGKNVLVFQNRRGYAGHVQCTGCGNIPSCPRCNAHLGFHASLRVLKCHYCGYVKPFNAKCEICKNEVVSIQGYGTERMASSLSKLFEGYKVSILDSDMKDKFDDEARIIVGTSYMIRHDESLHDIGLILVANADNLLCSADFRTTEKAFRTIMTLRQMAKENSAEYIVQTRDFRQPVFKCLEDGDYMKFYDTEMEERLNMNFPPFSRLLKFEFRYTDSEYLHAHVEYFRERLINEVSDVMISPVFDPEVEKIDMQYITQIIIRLPRTKQGMNSKKKIIELLEFETQSSLSKLKVSLEVDPQ